MLTCDVNRNLISRSQPEWSAARGSSSAMSAYYEHARPLSRVTGDSEGSKQTPQAPSGLTVARAEREAIFTDTSHPSLLGRSHSRQSEDEAPSPPTKRRRSYLPESEFEQASTASQSRISLLREGFVMGRPTQAGVASGSPRDDSERTPRPTLAPLQVEGTRSRSRPSSSPELEHSQRHSSEERSPGTHHPPAIDLSGYRFGSGQSGRQPSEEGFHSPGSESGHVRWTNDS